MQATLHRATRPLATRVDLSTRPTTDRAMPPAMAIHRPLSWAAAVVEIAAMAGAIIGRRHRRRDMVVPATAILATAVLVTAVRGTAARVTRRRPVMAVRLRVVRATVVPAVLRLAMGNRPGRRVDMPVRSASPVVRWVRLREGNHNMCRAPVRLINAATATEEALGGLRLRRPSAFSDRVVQSGLTRTAATAGLGAEARQPPFDWLRLRFVAVGDDLGLARLPH
jgi:hypothetical protein